MYDLTTIKRISKNDTAVIRKYIQAFISSSQEELKTIDEYMTEDKWNDIADVLHKMKTSVAYFFMDEIEQKVIDAEVNIKNNVEKSIVRDQIKEIDRLLAEVFQSLKKEISSPSKP
jgi:HPt (histidine-containing phosphotransfer) domain-containing protein